jgi:hypothetical protein
MRRAVSSSVPHHHPVAPRDACTPGLDSSCAPPLQVMTEKLDPVAWNMAVRCTRLPPVRGVPAVNLGGALVLLTADSLITVGVGDGDPATAMAAAEQLRPAGAELSRGPLPPPDPAALQILEAACGKNPGDTGRSAPDQGPQPARESQVPDFSVDRLGGGELHWASYRGKPVVVVVGDVPHVVRGIQRVLGSSATWTTTDCGTSGESRRGGRPRRHRD